MDKEKELKEIEDKFDKKYTRKSLGCEDKGKYRDDWFIKEVQSKEIKQFYRQEITNLLEKQKADILEEIQNCWLKADLTPKQTQEIIINLIEKL